jgi:hypothetical protein
LEGVLRVLLLAQNLAAETQDHGAMALHQLREALLIAPERKAFQQLSIGQVVCANSHSSQSLFAASLMNKCLAEGRFFNYFVNCGSR